MIFVTCYLLDQLASLTWLLCTWCRSATLYRVFTQSLAFIFFIKIKMSGHKKNIFAILQSIVIIYLYFSPPPPPLKRVTDTAVQNLLYYTMQHPAVLPVYSVRPCHSSWYRDYFSLLSMRSRIMGKIVP